MSLKMQNDRLEIRNLEDISDEAGKNGFSQENFVQMPANNLSIIYRKVC